MNLLSKLKVVTKATVATTLLAAAVVAIPAAQAEVRMNTTGGGSCKGSSGFGAQYFFFANTYAQNTNASGQYLTCDMPYANIGSADAPSNIQVLLLNPTGSTVQFTCALQAGYDLLPTGSVVNTSVYVIDVTSNEEGNMNVTSSSTPAMPLAPNAYAPYTLSCLMPPQTRLGLIQVRLINNL